MHHRDRVDSTGFGYKRSTSSGRFDFGIDYLRSATWSGLDFAVGSALTTKPLPRDNTTLDSLNIYATYKMRENMSMRMGFWHEVYSSTDWAVDGVAANQLAKAGYTNVYNIINGLEGDRVNDPGSAYHGKRMRNGWKNCGLPWTYDFAAVLLWASQS